MVNREGGGPPRLARSILRRIVPPQDRDVADGELLEGFALRSEQEGEAAARRWYRLQVWGFVLRAASVRTVEIERGEGGVMGWFDDVRGDVRWSLRSLRKRPTFTAVAVVTLALGIGANSAIFTLVSAHFLAPLPYDRPDELVLLWETGRNNLDENTVAPGNYYAWREQATALADIAAFNVSTATLSGDGVAERVTASVVTPHFFEVLGSQPALGRGFSEEAVRRADGRLAIIAHSLWVRRYGSDPAVVGTDMRISGRPYTIVGVMAPEFRQPERSMTWQRPEVWRPFLLDDERADHQSRYLRTIARLGPGVTVEQAREEMLVLSRRLNEAHPVANAGRSVLVRTLDDYLMGGARPTLVMLLIAGFAVLLIVCANVANLTLARGEERRREFAVRAALGSGRMRLMRQVLIEGVTLAAAGGTLGAVFIYGGGDALQAIQARFFTGLVDVAVDWRVIAFTAALAVGTGLLFGLPLARSVSRPDLRGVLIEGGERAGGGRGAQVTRSLLIVGQVSLATTLLVVATLLSRSFTETVNVPPGFEAEGVVTFTVAVPRASVDGREGVIAYHRDVISEVESIPGVSSVGMISDMPFTTENRSTRLRVDGLPYDAENPLTSEWHVVLPEYFEVLGIPLLAGSMPHGWDVPDEIPILVSERFAEMVWPGEAAVGRGMSMVYADTTRLRVAGVVGNVLDDGFKAEVDPVFYVPFAGAPQYSMSYVVGSLGDPADVVAQIRPAVARVNADVPASGLRLLEGMLAETVARPRAASLIGMTFAALALLVAAAGIYGVLSYAVQTRTREIGIRSALGADAGQLVAMVMGSTVRLVAVGLSVGVVGALVAGSALSGLLFGVRAWDPLSLGFTVVVLGGVASVASWIPARRAVRIDPKEALRAE